ncbi:MAG TPA: DUF4190 domain-containing protein [Pyrinomonadaceae bacterium]|nr:DUF4190 domain-containing protein [Pyrinomonadaceae bacterium]
MSFCPEDGMILVDPSLAGIKTSGDPSSRPSDDPTLVYHPPVEPGSWATPDVEPPPTPAWTPPRQSPPSPAWIPPVVQTPPAAPAWRPPPPPAYVKPASPAIGVASMIVGILSMVFGVLCFGPVIGIVAVALGIVALTQNKKMPQHVGGRGFAIAGIVTGGLSLLMYGGMMLFVVLMNL